MKTSNLRTKDYLINLLLINPYEIPLYLKKGVPIEFQGHYNIGFWLWELEEFPFEWKNRMLLFDEIWTPSEFISRSIRKETHKPVFTLPYPIEAPLDFTLTREHFNLPEGLFLFLVMGDASSILERKNISGAIQAYKEAFSIKNMQVGLVIKTTSASIEEKSKYMSTLKDYPNIFSITEVMDKTKLNTLLSLVDVFVSLHRSEGFGLVLAESMLVETPTIATNWSANIEFADASSACLVDFYFIKIQKDIGPYKAGNRWADPHIQHAAYYMQKLFSTPQFYASIQKQAKNRIVNTLTLRQSVYKLEERVYKIKTERGL